jgi:hypothetical protein
MYLLEPITVRGFWGSREIADFFFVGRDILRTIK